MCANLNVYAPHSGQSSQDTTLQQILPVLLTIMLISFFMKTKWAILGISLREQDTRLFLFCAHFCFLLIFVIIFLEENKILLRNTQAPWCGWDFTERWTKNLGGEKKPPRCACCSFFGSLFFLFCCCCCCLTTQMCGNRNRKEKTCFPLFSRVFISVSMHLHSRQHCNWKWKANGFGVSMYKHQIHFFLHPWFKEARQWWQKLQW